jgi:hypothetical protein
VSALAPQEFVDDLLDDLADVYAQRRETTGRARAWLVLELARTPWLGLHAQSRRMRAAGTRRELRVLGGPGLPGFGSGLRVAARSLLKRPQYAGIAVLTLALSIGAATLIFSVLEGVLLRRMPYEGGERVHRIFATNQAWRDAPQEVLRQSWDRLDITEDMVVALRGQVPGAEALGAYTKATVRLDDGLDPVQLPGARILPGFFETLPMRPLLGRLPRPEETEAGTPVVVLSERLWTSRYGRDPEIIGRQVTLGGVSHTVIGVLPDAFAVPDELARWWAPLPPDFAAGSTDHAVFVGLVRLSAESDAASLAEDVTRVSTRMAETNATYAEMGVCSCSPSCWSRTYATASCCSSSRWVWSY